VSGAARVSCVVESLQTAPVLLVALPGGLRVTAWHPVVSKGAWAFPAALAATAGAQVDGPAAGGVRAAHAAVEAVYSVALAGECGGWQGLELNGTVAITLGHGVENDPVASHPYYGTGAVLRDMFALAVNGKVTLPAPAATATARSVLPVATSEVAAEPIAA
jgi:hypothetical protein